MEYGVSIISRTTITSILLLFLLPSSFSSSLQPRNATRKFHTRVDSKKPEHINDYLKKINKPAVKTIQSPYGDIIDCVLIHQQLAFDHPLLKGQTPIMEPFRLPSEHAPPRSNNSQRSFRAWTMPRESCPENTVAIKRAFEEDVLRASWIKTFRRNLYSSLASTDNYEYAMWCLVDDEFCGVSGNINVWSPQVRPDEFSVSQFMIIGGPFDDGLNIIQFGWQVSQYMYNDSAPRFFIFWTITNKSVIGAPISPVSTYDGQQFHISVAVWMDRDSKNWVLTLNDEIVGYWPPSLFTRLNNSPGTNIEFGGEVINGGSDGYHTTTQMGSGHFAEELFGKAAFFKDLQWMNRSDYFVDVDPDNVKFLQNAPKCYDLTTVHTEGYYGGPGRNINCP